MDELKDLVRERKKERNALNKKVQDLANEIKALKEERDSVNEEIQELKDKRDELNDEVSELISEIKKVSPSSEPPVKVPAAKLEKKLERLEFKHQTSSMSPKKEKEFVKKIEEVRERLKARKLFEENNKGLITLSKDTDDKKRTAQKYHNKMMKLAEISQRNHETMISKVKLLEKTKKEANKIHQEFIDYLKELRAEQEKHMDDKQKQALRKIREAKKNLKKEAKELAQEISGKSKFNFRDLQKIVRAGEDIPIFNGEEEEESSEKEKPKKKKKKKKAPKKSSDSD